MKNFFLIIILLAFPLFSFAQPANDECTGAIDLGTLPTPNDCGGGGTEGQGAVASFTGLTNVNATAANPYSYMPDCQGSAGNDMANPAQDVWYSFTATGNSVTVDLSNYTGTFTNPSIGLWEGTCASLTARGCDNGNGGSMSVTFEPTTPGQTYYLQISGEDETSEGTFDLDISNSNDCSQCNLSSGLTMDPAPTNGTYPVGTEVTFCYTVSEFEKVNSNWLHGVTIESLGDGWDLTYGVDGIANTTVDPSTCQGNYGTWGWYDSPPGCVGNNNPGWYYLVDGSNSVCNNYGDPGLAEPGKGGCSLTFCFTLRTKPLSGCNVSNPGSLNVTVETSADGETGNWTSSACTNDPSYEFAAVQACCDTPTVVLDSNVACFGGNDGQATATAGSSSDPFIYRWFNSSDSLEFETSGTSSTTDVQSALSAGTYTVWVIDNTGCVAANTVDVLQNPGATITVDTNQVACENSSVTVVDFVTNPVTATFQWTATNDIGFGTFDSTQIGTFTAVNGTSSPITSDVTATPYSSGCGGVPQSFSITVNPLPLVSTTASDTICSPETVDLISSFSPVPTTYNLSMTNDGLTAISQNSSGATGTGTDSVVISGVEPDTLVNGQILSACFSLKHKCYTDIDWFTLTVDGTTYTSTSGSPAGATYNADLADMLDTIQAATSDVTIEVCFPQSFLDLLDGTPTNSTWELSVNDFDKNSCGNGNAVGDLVDFTVEIQHTPAFSYSWSPDSTLSGSTSGATTVDTVPTVIANPSSTTTYTLSLSDPNGCVGTQATTVNVYCPMSMETLSFSAKKENNYNVLQWITFNNKEVKTFNIERANHSSGREPNWNTLVEIKSINSINSYSYTDKSFESGNNYYRLRVLLEDGTSQLSSVIVLNNESKSKAIKAVYNSTGQLVDIDYKGLKFIHYEDGSIKKVFDY